MIATASYTDTGGRPHNEDTVRLAWQKGGLCLVVADGLGGHGGGGLASAAAAEVICGGWDGQVSEEALARLIQQAHQRVLALQTRACSMKTTVTALETDGRQAAWAHAGDSRIYHFVHGTLVFQSRDHSASQIAVTLGTITPDQIRFHVDRSRVYRALGQDGELKVESHGEALAPGHHAFLLCSDGFWEYVYEEEMAEDLAAAASPEDWLARMRARLAARVPDNNDNNTAAAVWLDT